LLQVAQAALDDVAGLGHRHRPAAAGPAAFAVPDLVGRLGNHGFDLAAGPLRLRAADDTAARLAAEMGVLAFSTAYARWAAPDNQQPFTEIARAALRDLQDRAGTLGTGTNVCP
jgi:hypothetical protein